MKTYGVYIVVILFFGSIHFSNGQTISSMFSDSVYKPLLKAAQKHIFKNKYSRLWFKPMEWDLENSYQDTNKYEFPYYKVDTLRNLFSKKDFGEQVDSIVIKDWGTLVKQRKLETEEWNPYIWDLSIPIFSLDRQYALMLGWFTKYGPSQGYMFLFKLVNKKHWKLINVINN